MFMDSFLDPTETSTFFIYSWGVMVQTELLNKAFYLGWYSFCILDLQLASGTLSSAGKPLYNGANPLLNNKWSRIFDYQLGKFVFCERPLF